MNENKIVWCGNQRAGIELIEPKPHLSIAYMKEADETLENVFTSKGKWKVITAYYACYNALYSLLMKCGIKSEIHDCTLEIAELLGFDRYDEAYIRQLKEDRIHAQYYLKNIALQNEEDVKKFVVKSKILLSTLDSKKVEGIRTRLKELIEKRRLKHRDR